jgi:Leucine-rich repeat (LRR) protein
MKNLKKIFALLCVFSLLSQNLGPFAFATPEAEVPPLQESELAIEMESESLDDAEPDFSDMDYSPEENLTEPTGEDIIDTNPIALPSESFASDDESLYFTWMATSADEKCITLKTTQSTDLELDRGDATTAVIDVAANKETTLCHTYDDADETYEVQILNPEMLSHLDLSGQELTAFQGGKGEEIRILDLSQNQLSQLSIDTFFHYPKLEILYLQQNNLELLPAGIFDNLDKMYYLDISKNHLRGIES